MAQWRLVWLGLGANVDGLWGSPEQSIGRALAALESAGYAIAASAPIVSSIPYGIERQNRFLNTVVAVRSAGHGPFSLLLLLKRLERDAGRRNRQRWGPRPLDIDILDYRGLKVRARSKHTGRGSLVVPHPGIAERGFVLAPLVAVCPHWRHPASRVSAREMLKRRPRLLRGLQAFEPSRGLAAAGGRDSQLLRYGADCRVTATPCLLGKAGREG